MSANAVKPGVIVHSLAMATSNAGKLQELLALAAAADLPIQLFSLSEIAPDLTVIEDGRTFAVNAVKKATALATVSAMLSLADDSGLEVDALGGAPGVFSARYASTTGAAATDAANNAKLLVELAALKDGRTRWPARFRCALALVDPFATDANGKPADAIVVEATCEGHIIAAPRGDHGFGYDPLFVVATSAADGKAERTLAELDMAEKLAVSHRSRAFRELIPRLVEVLAARNAPIMRVIGRASTRDVNLSK